MHHLTWAVFAQAAITFLLSFQTTSAVAQQCSSSQQCPKSSPCCGVGGTCGSGALSCAGGCQPMASFAASSCLPNPLCQTKNITFAPTDYNNPHMFWPILLYNGNATSAPFTLDYGYLGKGSEGVLLELTQQSQVKISTTDYMLYGSVSLEARHDPFAGLVFAFITMSDTKDEIDWEFTTSNPNDLQTNYFAQGVIAAGSGLSVNKSSISVSDWHTYTLNWQPSQLQWLIDGQVMRTVTKGSAGQNYPRSPSRVQISVWAGGNSTNAPGVIAWAGGAIDWSSQTYTSQGYFSAEIRSFSQSCAPPSQPGINTIGTGNTTTSWVYTGQQSTTLGEPEYVLSTNPITFLKSPADGALPGLPGYSEQSAFTKSNTNAWDGSGSTSGLSSKDLASAGGKSSSSGGWLANNRTLSIVVPVVAAVIALIFLWALAVRLCRKARRRNERTHELNSGAFGRPGTPLASGIGYINDKSSKYHALNGADDDEAGFVTRREDPTPMGAQRIGQGYGPAVGPRPGPMHQKAWSGSSSSLIESRAYDPNVGRHDDRQSYNVPPPSTPFGVRGPYTPGMDVYTPGPQQISTMHQAYASSPAAQQFQPSQYPQQYTAYDQPVYSPATMQQATQDPYGYQHNAFQMSHNERRQY